MKDLSDRFAASEGEHAVIAAPDPLMRLQPPEPDGPDRGSLRHWLDVLRGRADFLTAICVALAALAVLWPLLHPATVQLPAVADTGDEVATLTVRPLTDSGIAAAPDWSGLFNAYSLETSLRDISIRCNYGLAVDARVDRYLHARLTTGTAIRVFLADPGKCPKN